MTEQATLQKALYTIKKLKHLLNEQQKTFEPIAITGISCRFPQAVGKDAYWNLLKEGRNIIANMPEARWELLKGSDESLLRDKQHPYWGGFLSDIDLFDAYYFGISPREAVRIDPQHRLLLEVAHEAIEDAGIPLESLAGTNTGVFASLYVSQLAHLQKMDHEMDALYLPTGNAISIAANRISYMFDLRGPSIIIDSACSSSMTSLYLACQNLQNKTCDLALVCGAKLNLLPYVNFVLSKAKMLSPDGQCKTFDADANGYVQGEGVGVIVLKPLTRALQDNDRIYAVIAGSAINQDGRTNGLTAPNGLQQELLLSSAYQTANITPQDISYVECHGTGTFLGDPIEVEALGEIVSKNRTKEKPCWIGSVKTNIGHLEPAAGIASIIKVALSLKNKKIPPHLNFSEPNPHIPFDKYYFKIPKEIQEWPIYGSVRVAGISGFGFGGANAHVVLRELFEKEAVAVNVSPKNLPQELFTLSAKNNQALDELVLRWHTYLNDHPLLELSQICFDLHVRRSHYSCRLAIIATSLEDLKHSLSLIRDKNYQQSHKIFIGEEKTLNNSSRLVKDFADLDLEALAKMYVNNITIDWKKYEEGRSYPHMDMPLYPWQHRAYWPPLGTKNVEASTDDVHPLQPKKISSPLSSRQFEFIISSERLPDLKDTYNILHAGYFLEMLAYSVKELTQQTTFTLEDHQFLSPVIVPKENNITVQLILEEEEREVFNFKFYSRAHGHTNWLENAKGKLITSCQYKGNLDPVEKIKERCSSQHPASSLYEKVRAMGMPAGESIRWTAQFWCGENEILCEFKQPPSTSENQKYHLKIHPSVFDACIQPIFKLLPDDLIKPYIASGARRVHFIGESNESLYLWGEINNIEENGDNFSGNCCLINTEGKIIAVLENITLKQLDNKLHLEDILQNKATIDISTLPIEERKSYIINFLIDQVAIIFSIPKEDITLDSSLRDLGIDSLMALVLMRAIEVGLEANYTMQDLLEGPTINELADFLANTKIEKTTITNDPWISYRRHQIDAKVKLFCLPYGGGGASFYRNWQDEIPSFIEVCPIQLPGREERMDEKPIDNINTLLEFLLPIIEKEANMPFAFLGHSFGSLIAFELIRKLRKNTLYLPTHLFISAFPEPSIPTKSLDKLLANLHDINITVSDIDNAAAVERLTNEQLKQIYTIFNDNGIVAYSDYLLEKEIMKVLLPIFIGDMGIVKSYRYYDEEPLTVPITVFAGRQDSWVEYEDHQGWSLHTTKEYEIVEFDAGHMFIKEEKFKKQMQEKIVNSLRLSIPELINE